MKILIDTNVILDVLCDRTDFVESSSKIWKLCEVEKIDGYISERPGAMAAETANPNLKYITFEKGKGFEYSNEEVDVAVGLKKGNTDLKDQIDKILAGITEEERQKIMEDAIKNQPLEN